MFRFYFKFTFLSTPEECEQKHISLNYDQTSAGRKRIHSESGGQELVENSDLYVNLFFYFSAKVTVFSLSLFSCRSLDVAV